MTSSDSLNKNILPNLIIPRQEARNLLIGQLDKGKDMLEFSVVLRKDYEDLQEKYELWHRYNITLLKKIFDSSEIAKDYSSEYGQVSISYPDLDNQVKEFKKHLSERIVRLKSIEATIDLYPVTIPSEQKYTASDKNVPSNSQNRRRVFVIHGRNNKLKDSIFAFLRAIGLEPIEWAQLFSMVKKTAPYIGEILDKALEYAQAIVVILSGDDEARLFPEFIQKDDKDYERLPTPQPRPNVLFEAGMALSKSQDRTILVQIGDIRPWSDIGGRHVTKLDNSIEKRQELIAKLRTAKCDIPVDISTSTGWINSGDFETDSQMRRWNDIHYNEINKKIDQNIIPILNQAIDLKKRIDSTTASGHFGLSDEYFNEFVDILNTAKDRLPQVNQIVSMADKHRLDNANLKYKLRWELSAWISNELGRLITLINNI